MYEYRGKHSSSVPWQVVSSSGHRPRHKIKNTKRRKWIILVFFVVLILLIWPFLEARFVRIERTSLTSEDLSSDIGHLHVVYVSDIHYGYFFSESRVNDLISKINALRPDIVLFGGDYATDNESAINFFKILPSIHARYASFAVIGEHDRGDTDLDLELLEDAMLAANVTPLINEVTRLPLGSSCIYIAGVDDSKSGVPDLSALGAKVSTTDFVIFLAHNPSVISSAQNTPDKNGKLGWFDLALFGHTHGGQMRPFSSLLDISGDDLSDRYRSGWLTENRTEILVSNGVGTSVLPMRMLCPPQIHYIDISTQ